MGNAESTPQRRRKRTREELAAAQVPPNYTNRYSSPFNRTQFLNHSASATKETQGGNEGLRVLSCLSGGDDDAASVSCLALPGGNTGGGAVKTLYDVEANTGRQIVWEYQRFHATLGWGAANFEDPGDLPLNAARNVRFATHTLDHFGDSMQAVAPPVPPGWQVDMGWAIVIQRRTRKRGGRGGGDIDETGISDRFGWHYGKHLTDSNWANTHLLGHNLRRRAWNRLLIMKQDEDFIEDRNDQSIGDSSSIHKGDAVISTVFEE